MKKNKKRTIDMKELMMLVLDAECRMIDTGSQKASSDYLPTGWQRQGSYEYEFNQNGYTGNYRAAA